jgi:predicted component of type VI protein secretion system
MDAFQSAGGGFTSWCLTLKEFSAHINSAQFPLHGHLAPISNVSLAFQARSISLQTPAESAHAPLPRLILSLYTLAGVDGPLPLFLSERLLIEKSIGDSGLVAFLDMLNLRMWEFVFLRDIAGHDPRYIGFCPEHANRLDQLTHAVGKIRVPEHYDALPHLHRLLLQHGFTAGHLGGDATNLGAVLGSLLDCKVEIKRHVPVRLDTTKKCVIGRLANTRLKRGAALGERTWVGSGTDIVVPLNVASDSPHACDRLLVRAHHCVAVLFGAMAPLVTVHIRVPRFTYATRLGRDSHQLGRLATLGHGASGCWMFRTTHRNAFTQNNKEFA